MIDIFNHKVLTDYDNISFEIINVEVFEKIIPLFGQNYVYSIPGPVLWKMNTVLSPAENILYKEFLQELERSPKRIFAIRILSNDYDQLIQNLDWYWGDADGSKAMNPDFPLSYLSIEQYVPTLIDMIQLNRILTKSIYCLYKLLPLSTVNITIYYEEFDLTDLL